jgi:membrane protease YdiL (CAAX protease family)
MEEKTVTSQMPQGSDEVSFVDRRNIHPALFALLSLAFVFVLYQVGGGLIAFFVVGSGKIDRGNVNLLRLFTLLGQLFLILLPTLVLARLFSRRQGEVFPLRLPAWQESLSAVIALLSMQRIFEVYIYFQNTIALPEFLQKLFEPLRRMLEDMVKGLVQSYSIPEFVFVVCVVAIVPAIVEEFLFRGLVQKSFERTFGPLASAIVTGTIFGLFHLNPFELVPLIGIGCFLGFLRFRSKSIVLPVLMHFLNNLLAVTALKLAMGDEKIMMAPSTDQPGFAIVLAQLLLFGALFVVSLRFYIRSTERVAEIPL